MQLGDGLETNIYYGLGSYMDKKVCVAIFDTWKMVEMTGRMIASMRVVNSAHGSIA